MVLNKAKELNIMIMVLFIIMDIFLTINTKVMENYITIMEILNMKGNLLIDYSKEKELNIMMMEQSNMKVILKMENFMKEI